jgi:glycosyltransferase involved in cell wall biosynthesis
MIAPRAIRMRLGFILQPQKTNSIYRVMIPMNELAKRGHAIVCLDDAEADTPMAQLYSCDLVHCFRRGDRLGDLERLSRRGVAISFDNDDDFASSDVAGEKSSLEGLRANRKYAASFERAALTADLVTTPSPTVAERYRAAGAGRVTVIENYLDQNDLRPARKARDEDVTVCWVAGVEHAVDVPQLKIVEALSRLLETHANVRVLTVGVRLPLRGDRYEHIPEVTYERLLQLVSEVDVGIAPLVDNPFNRARSDVKLKEYAAGGTPWLASAVGPYLGHGEKQGGRLVEHDRWPEELDRLVGSRRDRARLARRAERWAKTQTIARHVEIWESELESAVGRAGERMARLLKAG